MGWRDYYAMALELQEMDEAELFALLDGLEQQQLLVRQNNTSDRRVLTVKLTEAGQELCEHLLPYYIEWLSGVFSHVPQDVRQRLSSLLSKALQGDSTPDIKVDKPLSHPLPTTLQRSYMA